MDDLTQRLDRIEAGQAGTSAEMKAHQLNDSLEFSKAKQRDEEAKEARERIEEKLEGLATKEDMQKIQPLLEAIAGGRLAITWGRFLYKLFIAIGAIALAWLAIKKI